MAMKIIVKMRSKRCLKLPLANEQALHQHHQHARPSSLNVPIIMEDLEAQNA